MNAKTLTLREYASARKNVVLFYHGANFPNGCYLALENDSYLPLADPKDPDWVNSRHSWLDLVGEVDAEDDWRWLGEGNPKTPALNTVAYIHAYVQPGQWKRLV